jgi:mitochondrial fission process protein 1
MTNVTEENINSKKTLPINIFRDTSLRYLGYANEIGESFRYQYPKFVVPSYVVAFGYCLTDAICTGYNSYNHTTYSDNCTTDNNRIQRSMIGTFDTLLWQSLASVVIPGYCIHMIVKVTKYTLTRTLLKQIQIPMILSTWLPTITGLISIPLIIHPIDHSVDYVLDNSVRTLYQQYL